MSIRNLFFRESECKKPSDSPFPCGLRASHPFWRPAPLRVAGFGLRCRCAACSPSVLRTLFAACPASRRRLRTAVALSGLSSSSVLRTLFGGPPRFASRASDCGSPFRAVLVLGASHPFCGLPRFASRASDCASAARRARPRCFAPFLRPAPLCVAGFGLRFRCAACSSSVLRTLFGKQKPRTEARGVMIPFWFPCFENQR